MTSTLTLLAGCSGSNGTDEPKPTVTVTFDSQGGSAVASVAVEQGSRIVKPANPTYGEFIFVDWFKDKSCTNVWDFGKDVVESNITLYAKWTTITYTLTFNTNGGSAIAPVQVAKGGMASKPLPPTKSGSAFDNWYSDTALSTTYNFSTPVTADLTIYAKWIAVDREALRLLLEQSYTISSSNYTKESYAAMVAKRTLAEDIMRNQSATAAQIDTAYTELAAAINALVELVNRAPVSLYVGNQIDGVVYVTPDLYCNLYASANAADDEPATDPRVTFEYNESELQNWASGSITVDDHSLGFQAKSTLTAGQTISITIKAAADPTLTRTITLKVAGENEMKAIFINHINALPEPEQIEYKHMDAIDQGFELYRMLSNEEQQDPVVVAAYKKLQACEEVYFNLPERARYSFQGNICTLTPIYGEDQADEDEVMVLTYLANGAFPAGTYSPTIWEVEKGTYYQTRLTFNADGTGITEYRESDNADDTTLWEEDGTFTYTYTGTQATGGMFFLSFAYDEEQSVKPNLLSTRLGKSLRTIR